METSLIEKELSKNDNITFLLILTANVSFTQNIFQFNNHERNSYSTDSVLLHDFIKSNMFWGTTYLGKYIKIELFEDMLISHLRA